MKQKENQLNISDSELLEYIESQATVCQSRPPKFGLTATEYAMSKNPPLAFSTARRILGRLVLDGKLKTSKMKEGGRIVTVYHK